MTLCTQQKSCFFDDVRISHIAETCWLEIPLHKSGVELDEWVLMPNHLHGILVITNDEAFRRGVQLNAPTQQSRNPGNRFSSISPHPGSLSTLIRTYKAAVTTQCRAAGLIEFAWQRGFYDHVIRNEQDLKRIQQYIQANPSRWLEDQYL